MIQRKAQLIYDFEASASDSDSKFIPFSHNDIQLTGIRWELQKALKNVRNIQELTMCEWVLRIYACGVSIYYNHTLFPSIWLQTHSEILSYRRWNSPLEALSRANL